MGTEKVMNSGDGAGDTYDTTNTSKTSEAQVNGAGNHLLSNHTAVNGTAA